MRRNFSQNGRCAQVHLNLLGINRASGLPFVVVFNEAQAGDKNDAKYSRKMYDASKGTGRNDQRGVLKNEKDSEKKYIRSARVKNLRTGDAGILSK